MLAQFLQYWRRLQTPKIVVRMRGEGMIVEEARSYCTDFQLALEGVAIEKNKLARTANFTFVLRSRKEEAFLTAFNALLQCDDVTYGQLIQQEHLGLDEPDAAREM